MHTEDGIQRGEEKTSKCLIYFYLRERKSLIMRPSRGTVLFVSVYCAPHFSSTQNPNPARPPQSDSCQGLPAINSQRLCPKNLFLPSSQPPLSPPKPTIAKTTTRNQFVATSNSQNSGDITPGPSSRARGKRTAATQSPRVARGSKRTRGTPDSGAQV